MNDYTKGSFILGFGKVENMKVYTTYRATENNDKEYHETERRI